MHLYLIRHAESEGNVNNHVIGGQSNHLPLTARGLKQAEALGNRFLHNEIGFDQIHSSTAVRSMQTVQAVGDIIGFDEEHIHFSDELLELSQGSWEGQVRSNIYTEEVLSKRLNDPWHFTPPGGESPKDVETRMYQYICQQFVEPDIHAHRIAIFSHGMSIKCLIRRILDSTPGMTYRIVLHNTSITHIIFQKNHWYVGAINDYAHLNGIGYVGHYGS